MKRLWIENRLKEIGKKKSHLGADLGLPPSRISEIISGKRRIQTREVAQLSIFLKIDVTTILQHIHREKPNLSDLYTELIPVVGQLDEQQNSYRLWPVEQHYIFSFPKNTLYESILKFSLEGGDKKKDSPQLYVCVNECDFSAPSSHLRKITKSIAPPATDPTLDEELGFYNIQDKQSTQNKSALIIAMYQHF